MEEVRDVIVGPMRLQVAVRSSGLGTHDIINHAPVIHDMIRALVSSAAVQLESELARLLNEGLGGSRAEKGKPRAGEASPESGAGRTGDRTAPAAASAPEIKFKGHPFIPDSDLSPD